MNNQNKKTKFRNTIEWKDFRAQFIQDNDGLCSFCGINHSKHTRKLELHHKDLNPLHYTDISNPNNFCLLCTNCHRTVHQFYTRVKSKKQPTRNKIMIDVVSKFFI